MTEAEINALARSVCRRIILTELNGVLCMPPTGEWGEPLLDAPLGRDWCGSCRQIWRDVNAVADATWKEGPKPAYQELGA